MKTSFVILLLMMAATNQLRMFIILFLSVTVHELAHAVTARLFGLEIESIYITPMGQAVKILGLNNISPIKRTAVILSGPVLNLVIAGLCSMFSYKDIETANLIIAFWNLLPSSPLDGGRFLLMTLSFFLGFSPANRICKGISTALSVLMICAGIVRGSLYPYDISLFAAAFYLWRLSKKESRMAAFDFYKAIFAGKEKYGRKQVVKNIFVPSNVPLKKVIDKICYDHVLIYYLAEEKSFLTIEEHKLVDYVAENGLDGTVGDVLALNNNIVK